MKIYGYCALHIETLIYVEKWQSKEYLKLNILRKLCGSWSINHTWGEFFGFSLEF